MADDMILYIENPKDSIRKLLELISEFSKVAEYKINTKKSLAFLYNNNAKAEREIKESIPFTIATKRIKYLGINFPKETKELYTENPKDSIRKLLELISEFSNIVGYKWQPTPVFLPGESQGQGSLVGCRLWGRTESDTTEATQQQQQMQTNICRMDTQQSPTVEHRELYSISCD